MPVFSILNRYTFEILYNVSVSSTYLLVLNTKMLNSGGGNKSGGDGEKVAGSGI